MKRIEISPRQFKGELPDMKQTKEERRFNLAHLKAYLKGKRNFDHGFYESGQPVEFQTKIVDRVLAE